MQSLSLLTDDFEELQDASTNWDQQYFKLSPGRFEGGIELMQVGSRQIFRERWGKKIRYQGTAPPRSFGFALPLDQPGTANWVGIPACTDTVILQSPGQEAELVSSDYWDALVLAVPEEEVRTITSVLSGKDDNSRNFYGVLTLKRDVADKLRRTSLDFLRMSKLACSGQEIQVSLWSEQFVKMFLWELVSVREGSSSVVGPSKHGNIVRQATELALSDPTCRIGLTELCAHARVSLRSLHYAFQDVTGMSPATWLRKIRLNEAHKTLLRSSPGEVLVKQVAIDHGFFHLGHFGRQYRSLFGCSPSHTLYSA